MNEQAIQNFSFVDFNPDKYVKEISQVCVGGHELQLERIKIQALSEETSAALKKNVYQNYMQFIETAKEISHLESEMYQLSHLLTEQSSLLSQLGNAVPPTPTPEAAAETARHGEETRHTAQLQAISEKVEGCPSLVDTPGRKQLHEGDLLQLDPVDNSPLHRVHAYLLSDAFLTASWISNRRGPARYKFQAMYELQSLAVVNVRDRGSVRHAFKLLAFPDSTVFQCSNNQSKRDWLERLELTKKCSEQQIRDSGEHPKSPLKVDSLDANPFEDNESDASLDESPDWLLEMPEDLDVCIAQRHFEEAYSMICKARDHMAKMQHTPTYQDIKRKLDSRITALINALMSELAVSPGKSLQGGLRAARRSVRLLNQLGRSTQACDLFLKLCTSLLKAQCKRVKREGATAAYVNRLGGIFFSNLAAITTEFQLRAFPHVPQCLSGFVVWLSMELNNFTSHLIKQIFMPQASLTTLAQCVHTVHTQCEQLCELGLDLCYQLDGQLASPLMRSLLETRDKLVDAVKMRSAEDTWRPTNMATKQAVHKLDAEWSEAGLPPIATFITGDSWLELTSNTVAFTKLFLSLLDDCMLLATPDLTHTIDRVLYDVFSAQLSHVAACINNDRLKPQRVVILRNANFLVDTLLHRCETKFKATLGHESSKLQQLHKEFSTGAKLSVTSYI